MTNVEKAKALWGDCLPENATKEELEGMLKAVKKMDKNNETEIAEEVHIFEEEEQWMR